SFCRIPAELTPKMNRNDYEVRLTPRPHYVSLDRPCSHEVDCPAFRSGRAYAIRPISVGQYGNIDSLDWHDEQPFGLSERPRSARVLEAESVENIERAFDPSKPM